MINYNNGEQGANSPPSSPRNNTSTSISVNSNGETKLGIINVMFTLDPSILSWAAGTFYDGKIEVVDDVSSMNGNQKTILMPNSDKYRCKICGETRTRSDWDYTLCKGTKDNPHDLE